MQLLKWYKNAVAKKEAYRTAAQHERSKTWGAMMSAEAQYQLAALQFGKLLSAKFQIMEEGGQWIVFIGVGRDVCGYGQTPQLALEDFVSKLQG